MAQPAYIKGHSGQGASRGPPPALALVLIECLEKQVLHVAYMKGGRQRRPKDSPHHLPWCALRCSESACCVSWRVCSHCFSLAVRKCDFAGLGVSTNCADSIHQPHSGSSLPSISTPGYQRKSVLETELWPLLFSKEGRAICMSSR